MRNERLGPSRVARLLLALGMGADRAAAVLGDLSETLAEREQAGVAPRWPRVWVEGQAWRYLMAAAGAAAPRAGRSFRYIVRDAWRALRSAPASTGFILLILTVAISAATVTFSVVDTVVLRDLPFERSDELVVVSKVPGRVGGRIAAPQEYLAWRERVGAFATLAAVWPRTERFETPTGVHEIQSARVTASLFDVLRVRPALGRSFDAGAEVEGHEQLVLLGHDLWQRHFGGDPGIVGRAVTRIDQTRSGEVRTPVVVLGVMPAGFTYPIGRETPVELWRPYAMTENERSLSGGGISSYLHVVGRLGPGVSLEQAEAQVEAAAGPLAAAFPWAYTDWRADVVPLYDTLVGHVRGWMLLVLWAVGLVMVVACVNVANLLLTRSARRARELAIRASLGASRRTLLTALVVEALMLSLAAAALGLLVAVWGIGAAKAALPDGIARAAGIALDLRVLGAAVGAAVATGLLFGAAPAWHAARADLSTLLKDGAPTVAAGRLRWRTAFLVTQVAFVGMLMVATTLFVSSFVGVVRADLGFDRSGLVTVEQLRGFSGRGADVAEDLRATPGVASVAMLSAGPSPLVTNASASIFLALPDAPEGAAPVSAEYRRVSPEYFSTARIPVVRGRVFGDPADAADNALVIDELLARELFGSRDPIGATVETGRSTATVIGVVRHVRLAGPEETSGPQVYDTTDDWGGARYLIRTAVDPELVVPAIGDRLARLAPTPPEIVILEDAFREITADRRFSASLMSVFGALALFIGAAGIYGVMASMVAQRTRELGVRMALGATAARIAREVLGQAGPYLVIGLLIGLPVAMATSRMFTALLFEVRPTDAFVYVTVAAILLAVGLAAAYVPARRAARVDPLVTLRAE